MQSQVWNPNKSLGSNPKKKSSSYSWFTIYRPNVSFYSPKFQVGAKVLSPLSPTPVLSMALMGTIDFVLDFLSVIFRTQMEEK